MISPGLRSVGCSLVLAAPLLAACASAPSPRSSAESSAATTPTATLAPETSIEAEPQGKPLRCELRRPPARKEPAFRFRPANYTRGRSIELDRSSVLTHPVGDEIWAWDVLGGTPVRRYDALGREAHAALDLRPMGHLQSLPVAVEGGAVLSVGGTLHGIDGSSGRVRWSRALARDPGRVVPGASLGNLAVVTAGPASFMRWGRRSSIGRTGAAQTGSRGAIR